MITRWRLQEGIKRGKKRAMGILGLWGGSNPLKYYQGNAEELKLKHEHAYRKTTKLCSCWMCSYDKYKYTPRPSDIRNMPIEEWD
jgi:hypothetical protein